MSKSKGNWRFKLVGYVALLVLAVVLLRPAFGQTQHGLLWSWTAVTQDTAGDPITVDGYNLYCGTASAGPFTKANASLVATTSFLETGLTAGTVYYCQVTAVKGSLESGRSATGSGTFLLAPIPPLTPSAVSE